MHVHLISPIKQQLQDYMNRDCTVCTFKVEKFYLSEKVLL